jgi:hypothetical protein
MKMGRVKGLKPKVIAKLPDGWWKPILCGEIHEKRQYLPLLAG